MKNEFLQMWVDALRSGDYKQTEGQLRQEGYKEGFCCLGVACDLYAKAEPELAQWTGLNFEVRDEPDDIVRENKYTHLPRRVRELLGFDETYESELVNMNDNGKSFEEIADRLEEDFA